jgi:hypothetical protein
MLLPGFRRLYKTDFQKEYQDFADALAGTVNINFELLYEALKKKVTLADNLASTVKDVDVTVDASGTPISTVAVTPDTALPIIGCSVINATNLVNSSVYPTSQPFVTWSINSQGKFQLNNISGLQANQKYRLKLVIWN